VALVVLALVVVCNTGSGGYGSGFIIKTCFKLLKYIIKVFVRKK
jgi:hypothetical protein